MTFKWNEKLNWVTGYAPKDKIVAKHLSVPSGSRGSMPFSAQWYLRKSLMGSDRLGGTRALTYQWCAELLVRTLLSRGESE